MALNPGANQYTHPAFSAKVCLMLAAVAGGITTSVNKGRQAGPMSGLDSKPFVALLTDEKLFSNDKCIFCKTKHYPLEVVQSLSPP